MFPCVCGYVCTCIKFSGRIQEVVSSHYLRNVGGLLIYLFILYGLLEFLYNKHTTFYNLKCFSKQQKDLAVFKVYKKVMPLWS